MRLLRRTNAMTKSLILILGDQLSRTLSPLMTGTKSTDVVLMVEVSEEATYVPHHKKKIAFLFSAMRHFAGALKDDGWTVDYVKLDDDDNAGNFSGEVERAIKRHDPDRVIVTEPGEWRVRQMIDGWSDTFGLPVDVVDDHRFIATHDEFQKWADGRKQLRMEYFYRDMRRKTDLLMTADDEPEGGKWNYDSENRKPHKGGMSFPEPLRVEPDDITQDVLALVGEKFSNHFGDLEPFWFGVTSDHAEAAFDAFVENSLATFGDFQDAMVTDERFLYHAVISHYMNAGLLDPLKICQRVADEYAAGRVPLNAAEGFIRQIIGWREYVRGIYWLKMPDYVDQNFFEADRPLPAFYWSADTDMACIRAAVTQTKEEAYAHHIQRLMITGNFALIAGIDPKHVHEWYLAVYADAYEWVELPNTLGMSQFADGGLLGSKPYASSGNYINKMSDYCKGCRYDVKQKTGDDACPFNPLYWDFLIRNRDKLKDNARLGQIYRNWDRMDADKQNAYLDSAKTFLKTLT